MLGGRGALGGDGAEVAEGAGEFEGQGFFGQGAGFDSGGVVVLEAVDQGANQMFGGGGAGGDQDAFGAVEPGGVQFGLVVDEVGGFAVGAGGFGESLGIGGVSRADDDDQVGFLGEFADGRLAAGGSIADVFFTRADDMGESGL